MIKGLKIFAVLDFLFRLYLSYITCSSGPHVTLCILYVAGAWCVLVTSSLDALKEAWPTAAGSVITFSFEKDLAQTLTHLLHIETKLAIQRVTERCRSIRRYIKIQTRYSVAWRSSNPAFCDIFHCVMSTKRYFFQHRLHQNRLRTGVFILLRDPLPGS